MPTSRRGRENSAPRRSIVRSEIEGNVTDMAAMEMFLWRSHMTLLFVSGLEGVNSFYEKSSTCAIGRMCCEVE